MRRAILTALALVVTLGFAAQASAKDAASLKGTTWITVNKDSEGNKKIIVMILAEDGRFIFGTEVKGEISRVTGTYTLSGSQIQILVDGRSLTMFVVNYDDESLLTNGGPAGNVTWLKVRK